MNITTFVQNFAEQFDETDPCEFTPDTVYKDIEEWSSLSALLIIAMVDENYDIRIKGEDIRNASTISDLYNIVQARQS